MSKDLNKMLKQAQKMQSQMMRAQEELKTKTVEGTAGGGMVKITMNGAQEVTAVSINKDVMDPNDTEMLEDLIMAAFKNAAEKVSAMSSAAMGGITNGLNIPGMG